MLRNVASWDNRRPEHKVPIFEIGKMLPCITLLLSILLRDSSHSLLVILVKDAANVGSDLTKKCSLVTEIESENVEFIEALQTAARHANIVIDEITVELQAKISSDNIFSNVG